MAKVFEGWIPPVLLCGRRQGINAANFITVSDQLRAALLPKILS